MPRKADMTSIHMLMTKENRLKINAFAERKGYKVTADYVRHLIEADMRLEGEDIDLSVDRGGYRGGSDSDAEE